ncbi:DUF6478 family protein [Sinirhodobacter sp. HNIBRBA609]|nr:DUF6478 family protein [Sinirhodobacter sp. HNIBRBA609]
MNKIPTSLLDRIVQARTLNRWGRAARLAERAALADLRVLRTQAQALRREVERVLHVSDTRLVAGVTGDAIERPLGCDWAWRPALWSGPVRPAGIARVASHDRLSSEVAVFHDCPKRELTLRQIRNSRRGDVAPFGLKLDVLGFGGSFLSVALDLPEAALRGLRRSHLMRLSVDMQRERAVPVFGRLNIKHGPNTAQVVLQLSCQSGPQSVEFDLGSVKFNEKRVEKVWLDLSFDAPSMNEIVLRDLHLLRHPRAEI